MKLAAVVLAAGAGTRFGGDKLNAEFRGDPLLSHAIRAARAAPVDEVIVVTRPGQPIGTWEGDPPVRGIEIDSEALSDSLKAGIAAASGADGAFVFLGDMPLVPHEIAGQLAARLGEAFAALPRHDGRPGHPVLLSARAFGTIAGLEGDEGAGRLLRARDDIVLEDWPDARIHLDIDWPEDIARLDATADKGGQA